MDALDNIFSRVSVRAYTDKRISEDAIHTILAGRHEWSIVR